MARSRKATTQAAKTAIEKTQADVEKTQAARTRRHSSPKASDAEAPVPKPPKVKTFNLHWGSGIVEEEATITTPYHRPCIQLLKFTDGEAKGQYEVRFCYYDHRGAFQRSPMVLDASEFAAMRGALEHAPKLKKLLSQLVR